MLKIGFLTAFEDSAESFDDFVFAEGWCARENLSVVARGMTKVGRGNDEGIT